MIDKLRKMFHRLRQSKRVLIISAKMSKTNTKFQKHSINPLLHLNCILNFSFFWSHSGKHYSCWLLIESLSKLCNLILANIFIPYSRNSCPNNIVRPFICYYRLKISSLHKQNHTLSLFYELAVSACDIMIHRELFVVRPPKYHVLVLPSPIYISAANFKALSLTDFAVPKIPLIFNYFDTLSDK